MGVYDIVCGVQVKCTPDQMLKEYNIGDKIKLKKGIYIGYEGWFRVNKNKVVDSGKNIYTKWGDKITTEKLMEIYGIVNLLLKFSDINYSDIFKIYDYIKKIKKERKNNV